MPSKIWIYWRERFDPNVNNQQRTGECNHQNWNHIKYFKYLKCLKYKAPFSLCPLCIRWEAISSKLSESASIPQLPFPCCLNSLWGQQGNKQGGKLSQTNLNKYSPHVTFTWPSLVQGKLRSIFVGLEDVLCQNCADNTLYMQIKDIRPPLNLFETGAAGIKSLKQVFFETPRGCETS